jgi:hypothetical protein
MDWFTSSDYWLTRLVFQRGLAALYVIAFVVAANQGRALIGERGLTPVPRFTAHMPFRRSPSLFHLHFSDRFFTGCAWLGAALAAAVVAGAADQVPLWAAMLMWLVLWLLYLSIVNVGQVWYGFGWESLLLETGFLAVFLGNARTAPPVLVLWLLRWLLFRVEFGAGLIKIRGDRCWRQLTCLYYHHETQPMPGPLSRFAHLLPKPVHRAEVVGNHFAQLIVPFFLFAPQPVASIAAAIVILTQLWLVVTGNFAWLNWITIVLAFAAVSDTAAHWLIPAIPLSWGSGDYTPVWFLSLVVAVSVFLVFLSYWPIRNLLSRHQLMNASFNRWHLVNAYGAFGSVTKERYEVIVEGTADESPGEDADWREYEFKGKPGDPNRMPRQFAPYHLRLDWLMWFLPLGSVHERWFYAFLERLLKADRGILRLLRVDPFDGRAPRWVRARLFHYRFATHREKRESGRWWVREPVQVAIPPVSLQRDSTRP